MTSTQAKFQKFVDTIRSLRDPKMGCPWDLEQDHNSLRPYLIEEAYEVLEAIDLKDDDELKKELGDVLLQVVLHAQVAADRKTFTIDDVLDGITEKMIRRHPHVFGTVKVENSGEVVRNWEAIKHQERQIDGEKVSMLAGVPEALPALLRAQRLGEKAAKVSFDWKSIKGVVDKVLEELGELQDELKSDSAVGTATKPLTAKQRQTAIEHELGDLLFSLCQLARWLGLSAEDALRGCSKRFIERFNEMETAIGRPLSELSEDELEAEWQKAKRRLKK